MPRQPKPKPGARKVFPFVFKVLKSRRVQGIKTYGRELETDNGRDPLWDAFEEAIDLVLYLGQELMQRGYK